MTKWTLLSCVAVLTLGLVATDAAACWDNSDQIILKLRKLNLNTGQLKDVFAYQAEHKAVVARAHKEGLGCRYHENHDAVFEKSAIGVLTDEQFKKHTGRVRTKVESLEHENYTLRKKVERLEKLLAEMQKQLDELTKKSK